MPHTLNQHELPAAEFKIDHAMSTDQFESLLLLLKNIDGAHKVSHEQITLQLEELHKKLDAVSSEYGPSTRDEAAAEDKRSHHKKAAKD